MADKRSFSLTDGLFRHSPLFVAGWCIAPGVIMSSTLMGAVSYAAVFTAVTLPTLMLASLLPKRIPYALRIILYTAAAAGVYIPVSFFLDGYLPLPLSALGVFVPMTATGEFIVSAAELRFFRLKPSEMYADILFHVLGLDISIIFLGAVRELFSSGGINGELYGIDAVLPLLSSPCGGFILIGLIGAFIKAVSK